jgi:hypothetical protein
MDPANSGFEAHEKTTSQRQDSACTQSSSSPKPGSAPVCSSNMEPTCKNRRGWRRIVRNFTPSWFSVNMGTGIVSILLHNLPYNGSWLYWISVAIFCLNVVLFVLFLTISTLRYILWPEIWFKMIKHPAQSMFMGTFPMGLATIVNMVVFVCVPAFGHGWAHAVSPSQRLLFCPDSLS